MRIGVANVDDMRFGVAEIGLLALVAVLVVLALVRHSGGSGGGSSRGAVLASWQLTPGVLNPDVTQDDIRSTVCRHGWTTTIRPPVDYTNGLKVIGLKQYGLHGPLSGFQEDHLISLELGGNPTDPRNLWPEPYPRAADVDKIENQLNSEVCSGKLTLADAQQRESALKHRFG